MQTASIQALVFDTLLVLATLGSALIAGVFFAFSSFVMGALARVAPEQGIAAMQSINVVVLRSWFMVAFVGTAAICLALATWVIVDWNAGNGAAGMAVLLGCALYVLGTFGSTIAFNVPLNDLLARQDIRDDAAKAVWARYLRDWTRWNHLRSLNGTLAAALFVVAAMQPAA
ncbi:anthrone oxygenase family protein [Uliginosibacterium sp. H1]|uniref:anthrone oxygenase family protein n=1 Tax=Uliginosibacterium sp. H1 TaxID=3114757 RepID=UPI002E199967|nr:anthrone oxygenase family protein [Uliginosibacterium sp. H1]